MEHLIKAKYELVTYRNEQAARFVIDSHGNVFKLEYRRCLGHLIDDKVYDYEEHLIAIITK